MGKCCKSVHNKILHKNVTWLYIILCSLHGRWGWFQTQEITLSHYNHYILAFSYKQIYCRSCCKSVHNKILHKNMTWLYIILCSLHGRWGWFQTQEITLSHYNHYILAFSYKQIYCTSCCKSVHNKILHESVTWLYFILSSLHIRKGWFQTLVDYVKNMVTCLSLGVTFNHMALSSAWELLGKQCW